jgi:AAA domain-containing protein
MATTVKKKTNEEIPGVKKMSDLNRHRATVLYGRSGTGKTTLAGSWPKPMLYLDIRDKGTDSISDIEDDDLDLVEIEDADQIDEILLFLIRNPKKYKTVIFDTMSQLQEMTVDEVAVKNKKKLKGKRAGDFGTLTKQDWGQVSSRMKSWIIDFRDLDMEVVFIAQDRVFNFDDDESTDANAEVLAPEVGPRLMPSVASVLNGAVSTIGHTFIRIRAVKKTDPNTGKKRTVEKKEYCLRLGPSPLYITKLRKPKGTTAPDFIVDPTYEDILDAIKGDL